MERVVVQLAERSYPIDIGKGLLPDALKGLDFKSGIALVTDGNVMRQDWFATLRQELSGLTPKCSVYEVPAGEGSKSLSQFSDLCSRLAQDRFSRKTTVLAVGGGVVGDLAGYLAASYLRGVRFIQIPTTLLAAVDSSVGGKTGVNLPEGKNLVGAFYQPEQVLVDLDFLETLSERELAAGMAEVIKYGLIRDPGLLAEVAGGRPRNLAPIIKRCVEIKAEIVSADEREETGLRAVLNFGHTLGHAIEQSVGYGELLHGEAISIGMVAATWLSERCAGLAEGSVEKVRTILKNHGLPITHPGLTLAQVQPALMRDKKAGATGIQWVLMPEIGRTLLTTEVSEERIREALAICSDGF
ncbi:MAG: 3-dehydroquinate synthase [Blastochloris sp.]|nr:3-dehydroquinate synthase [Blastochloris sp.]